MEQSWWKQHLDLVLDLIQVALGLGAPGGARQTTGSSPALPKSSWRRAKESAGEAAAATRHPPLQCTRGDGDKMFWQPQRRQQQQIQQRQRQQRGPRQKYNKTANKAAMKTRTRKWQQWRNDHEDDNKDKNNEDNNNNRDNDKKDIWGKTKSIFLCEAKKVRLVCGEKWQMYIIQSHFSPQFQHRWGKR